MSESPAVAGRANCRLRAVTSSGEGKRLFLVTSLISLTQHSSSRIIRALEKVHIRSQLTIIHHHARTIGDYRAMVNTGIQTAQGGYKVHKNTYIKNRSGDKNLKRPEETHTGHPCDLSALIECPQMLLASCLWLDKNTTNPPKALLWDAVLDVEQRLSS